MAEEDATGPAADDGDRVLVLDPDAGSADHADRVHELADGHGIAVRRTSAAGDAAAIAREMAPGSSRPNARCPSSATSRERSAWTAR